MIRSLLMIGAFGAAVILASCNKPVEDLLARSDVGDCFTMSGHNELGQPILVPTGCKGVGSASNIVATTAAVSTDVSAAPAACQPVVQLPQCQPAATVQKASITQTRRTKRKTKTALQVSLNSFYSESAAGAAYVPPSGYDYPRPDETRGTEKYRPPVYNPAPESKGSVVKGYSERLETQESRRSESYSYESRQSGSSGAYASQSGGYQSGGAARPCCAPAPAPRPCCQPAVAASGPSYPFDRDGYLTWPGKAR